MKRRLKGLRSQRKVRDYLLAKGWDKVYVIHHSRWSKDIWGLFDGFAIKKDVVMFFQVKTNKKPSMKPFREFYDKYNIPVKVFVVKDRKGVFEVR